MTKKVIIIGGGVIGMSTAFQLAEKGVKDIAVYNSCAVTEEAIRQVKYSIRKKRRDEPNTKIVVTGCAAQIEPQSFLDMKEVDKVLGK